MMKQAACEIAAMLVTMIGITGAIGILFKVHVLRDWGFVYDISLPTAIAFMLVGACLTHLLNRK